MSSKPGYWTSLHGVLTVILIIPALYFIFVEHAEHTLQYLPFMIIMLCPLMHIFMHKSHGGHKHGGKATPDLDEAYRRGFEAGRKRDDSNQQ